MHKKEKIQRQCIVVNLLTPVLFIMNYMLEHSERQLYTYFSPNYMHFAEGLWTGTLQTEMRIWDRCIQTQ